MKHNNSKHGGRFVPAATHTLSQPRQATTTSRMHGSDNIDIISLPSGTNYALGDVVMSGIVEPMTSARLGNFARSFQRIKWNRIRFTVEGAFPTTCGGGYIAAFIRDPTDVPPADPAERVRWAMAQQQSADAKWYDSTSLTVNGSPDLLYTSRSGATRFVSPGAFVIISKGGPGQVGSITVNMEWDVTLSEPSVEQTGEIGLWTAPHMLYSDFDASAKNAAVLGLQSHWDLDPHKWSVMAAHGDYFGHSANGTYFRARQPMGHLSGKYNNFNDYIPVHLSGFIILDNVAVAASEVTMLNGDFHVVAHGVSWTPDHPYEDMADWDELGAGYGPLIQIGDQFDVYPSVEFAKRSLFVSQAYKTLGPTYLGSSSVVSRNLFGQPIDETPLVEQINTVAISGEALTN